MPWKECNAMDERVKLIARFLEGEKVSALARATAFTILENSTSTPR